MLITITSYGEVLYLSCLWLVLDTGTASSRICIIIDECCRCSARVCGQLVAWFDNDKWSNHTKHFGELKNILIMAAAFFNYLSTSEATPLQLERWIHDKCSTWFESERRIITSVWLWTLLTLGKHCFLMINSHFTDMFSINTFAACIWFD